MSTMAIDIQRACVAYRETPALNEVSLQVRAGESVVLLGPNGAGKTTLLTAINGFTPLASGSIRVLGYAPRGREALEVRRRAAYVAQAQSVDPRMPITLRESVMTGLYGRLGWRRAVSPQAHAAVDALFERLHLSDLAARPLGHLSGGELRRAMVARALVQEPDILLLDEPTASLDDHAREDICRLMDELNRERGLTLLWVTHDLEALPDSCTRVLRMKQGRIVQDARPEEFSFALPGAAAASRRETPCGAGC